MAGDEMSPDGRTKWFNIYGDDPNKYKGFWKYYNSETPFGRANAAKINLSVCFLVGMSIYLYKKSKSKSKDEASAN